MLSPGDGSAMEPPDFSRSVDSISFKGGRLCPPNNTATPGFSDLPTALTPPLLVRVIYDYFQCQMALISTMNLNIEFSSAAD